MAKQCEYHDVCGRNALSGDHGPRCILHSENLEKDVKEFKVAFEGHREDLGSNFERFVFPGNINFEGSTFSERANFLYATFSGKVNFLGTTFEKMAYFMEATFEDLAYFRGATFKSMSTSPASTFKGATFKNEANFSDAIFKGVPDFSEATFEGGAYLSATYECRAIFKAALFVGEAHFSEATFAGEADFEAATFKGMTDFRGATFKGKANFTEATLGHVANFSSTFKDEAYFILATFKGKAYFLEVDYEREAYFMYATFSSVANFTASTFTGQADFQAATFEDTAYFIEARFMAETSFSMAAFAAQAFFAGTGESDRLFAGLQKDAEVKFTDVAYDPKSPPRFKYADFGKCRFLGTDLLHLDFTGVKWCTSVPHVLSFRRYGLYEEAVNENAQGERWSDATMHGILSRFRAWASPRGNEENDAESDTSSIRPWSEIERMYRELKHNYEKQRDYPRAGDFHVGEKEARLRHETRWGMKTLLRVYRSVSIYGERATPAALWVTLLIIVSAVGYLTLGVTPGENAEPLSAGVLADWGRALLLSFESTFFPVQSAGFEVLGARFLNVFQRIASPILIALLALALRQRVRR